MILLLLLAAAPVDEQRSAWRHRSEVSLTQTAPGSFAVLALPPAVVAGSQPEGADWRLVGANGDEIPYATLQSLGIEEPHEFQGEIIDTRSTPKKLSQWTVDLQAPRTADSVELGIDAQDFAKVVKLEGALLSGGPWQVLCDGTSAFDVMWNPRVHHTTFELAKSARVRFVRVSFDDHTSAPVALRGVTVRNRGASADERFTLAAVLGPRQAAGDNSVYTLTLPAVAFDTLTIESSTATFSRDVVITRGPQDLVHNSIYRYAKGAALGERTAIPVQANPNGTTWSVQLVGDNAAPLTDVQVHVSGTMPRLVFPVADSGPWQLYFGNSDTRPAHYDSDALRTTLGEHPDFAHAKTGPVIDNPRYSKPPPLRFVAMTGALLDVEHYRLSRRLILPATEDLYAVTLLPEEVSAARDDLGDIRIVDGEARQIPYVRSDEWIEKPMALTFTRSDTGHIDRYAVKSAQPFAADALLLNFTDTTYFSRVVRVLDGDAGPNGRPRVLFDSRVTRQEEKQSPLRIAIGSGRHNGLTLEIENGDNQALTLSTVQALVRVTQIAFKAKGAGQTTLLVGNAAAARPDYDIASLSQLVLAYAATPAEAGVSESNPAYRRHAADYFRDAPPTLMVWGALLALLGVLLVLTVRLVRKA